jgi:hypothetical protein
VILSGEANLVGWTPPLASNEFTGAGNTAQLPSPTQGEVLVHIESTIDQAGLNLSTFDCSGFIRFINSSSFPINIFWVNLSGQELLYKTLYAGYNYYQHTYYENKWRVRGLNGELLQEFTANSCYTTYLYIYNYNLPIPTSLPKASLGDRVWNDVNRNGLQEEDEQGIPGILTNIWVDSADSGLYETMVGVTRSDANGNYLFSNLDATKKHVVRFRVGACFQVTTPNVGNDDALDSDVADPLDNATNPITLSAGKTDLTTDLGLYENCEPTPDSTAWSLTPQATIVIPTSTPTATNLPPTAAATSTSLPTATNTPTPQLASLGNLIWNDLNRNGLQDAGEMGLAAVIIRLWVDNDNNNIPDELVAEKKSDSAGGYSFSALKAGRRYVVHVLTPTGFSFTFVNVGRDDTIDSDTDPATGISGVYVLAPGQTDLSLDIGLYSLTPTHTPTPTNTSIPTSTPTATHTPTPVNTPSFVGGTSSVGNFVWNDTNRNGLQDSGEAGIANVTVRLLDCSHNLLTSKTTAFDGFYRFDRIAAGCYKTQFVLPSGYRFSPANAGSDILDSDADPSSGLSESTTVAADQGDNSLDAGMHALSEQ